MGILKTPSYLNHLMKRLCACELESISPLIKIDSKPYFVHHQEAMPYITHRLGDNTVIEIAADEQRREYTVIGRVVTGHAGTGYKGETEERIYAIIPPLENLYTLNHYLKCAIFPEAMLEMSAYPVEYRRESGWRAFNNAGMPMPNQIGFEFTVTVQMILSVKKRY